MKVLSLFDGISCGYLALKRAGIKINKYYASEIDKYAIQISKKNFPDIIQLGDIREWKTWEFSSGYFDLIIGGSPCQGFSVAGKQLNFNDSRSKLYFLFEDILKELKPKFWLLENVKMKKEYRDIISNRLGVEAIEINSALVSAQNRKRLYWTNISGIKQPNDKNILLKDIIHEKSFVDTDKSYCLTSNYYKGVDLKSYYKKHNRQVVLQDLKRYIAQYDKTLEIFNSEVKRNKIKYLGNATYSIHNKRVILNKPDINSSYLFGCITPDRIKKRQNGQRFNIGKKFYTLTAQDRHGILIAGYIRQLTPVESERLQTLPDNYTSGISNSQRYKVIGNGWTVDIIKHIFEHLKGEF